MVETHHFVGSNRRPGLAKPCRQAPHACFARPRLRRITDGPT